MKLKCNCECNCWRCRFGTRIMQAGKSTWNFVKNGMARMRDGLVLTFGLCCMIALFAFMCTIDFVANTVYVVEVNTPKWIRHVLPISLLVYSMTLGSFPYFLFSLAFCVILYKLYNLEKKIENCGPWY